MGRPSEFTPETANLICERLIEGESLRTICRSEDMPNASTVCRWLGQNEEFRKQYAHAREAQADTLADECLDIADDATRDIKIVGEDEREVCNTEFVQRARLRVDTRKWMAAKLAPKKYGEKVAVTGGGESDEPIKTALTIRFV